MSSKPTSVPPANLLDMQTVSLSYGRLEALRDISLTVRAGSVVAIIGANGAGKSSVLKAISGMVRPNSGEIWFDGTRIDGWSVPDIVARGITHCPERRRLFPYMSVELNLSLGAYLRRDRKAALEDLERMYSYFPVLKPRRNQASGTLSGGEQQMLAIARALMSKPRLLLLDEPSLGLAPLVVARIGQMVQEINRRGVSIILAEQNANMALALSHHAYLLELGKVVLKGPSEVLLENEHVKRVYLGT